MAIGFCRKWLASRITVVRQSMRTNQSWCITHKSPGFSDFLCRFQWSWKKATFSQNLCVCEKRWKLFFFFSFLPHFLPTFSFFLSFPPSPPFPRSFKGVRMKSIYLMLETSRRQVAGWLRGVPNPLGKSSPSADDPLYFNLMVILKFRKITF